jgi:hypothetical protein
MNNKTYKTIGYILGITAYVLIFMWFDWKLALIIFLSLWSNNVFHSYKNKDL